MTSQSEIDNRQSQISSDAVAILELAINTGDWSLTSLYWEARDARYKCTLRRIVRVTPGSRPARRRLLFEHESGYGPSVADAIIDACQHALTDDSEVLEVSEGSEVTENE